MKEKDSLLEPRGLNPQVSWWRLISEVSNNYTTFKNFKLDGSPTANRTPINRVKICYPEPLDDRANILGELVVQASISALLLSYPPTTLLGGVGLAPTT